MSAFTNEILEYTQPHPFVLPGEVTKTSGWGPFQTSVTSKVTAIPFDGRYLEEIMYNVNLARQRIYGLPALTFNTYDGKGNVKDTFTPSIGRSVLNNRISIVAFANIVEDIKNAIETLMIEPDNLKSHFGRCFNIAHYTGFPFVSRALVARLPGIAANLDSAGTPFYSFPENISGETMHGAFHKFQYTLPSSSNSSRGIYVDAFKTARNKLTEGIPLLSRMQDGEWPITKQELLTVLGLSIYSKHSDFAKRPAENANWSSEANRYTIGDHKRIFYTFCSFVIQMLRYQVPKMENFSRIHGDIAGDWWTSSWVLHRQSCSFFWSGTRVSKMIDFESGKWHFCGHGACDGDGLFLDVPEPGWATSCTWFTDCEQIDRAVGPALPYGFAPAQVFGRSACQNPQRNDFFTFHKFQTFELKTEDEVAAFTQGGAGLMVRLTSGREEVYRYARVGGWISALSPWQDEPGAVVFHGGPITGENLYDKFEEANTNGLDTYHNPISSITIALQDMANMRDYGASCNTFTGKEEGNTKALITYVGFLDDMVHDPVEFLDD